MMECRRKGKRKMPAKRVRASIRILCAIPVFFAATASAHEIGTTRVSARFHQDRSYEIEIVTDAATLAEKLAVSAGLQPPAQSDPNALRSVLTGAGEIFLRRLAIAFDAKEVKPA